MQLRALLWALVFAAPVHAAFRCPARGGAPWRELRSAHFIVDTDAKEREATSLVRELERMHALTLQGLVGEQVEIPGRARVLAFSDQSDYIEMAGKAYGAYYTRGAFGEPTIVMPLNLLRENPEGVAHEVAHHVSHYLFPIQPAWFAEGIAEWVQTVVARPMDVAAPTGSHIARGAKVMGGGMAGSIPRSLVSWFSYDGRLMPAKELFAWRGDETITSGGRGHLASWVLYHWLWNHRSKAFAEYQKVLSDGGDATEAWRKAFPEFDAGSPESLARLDFELDRYRRTGQFATFKVTANFDGQFSEAAISSSDLHLLILAVRANWPDEKEQAASARRAIVEEAIAEDPGNPVALLQHAKSADKFDPVPVRAAAAARPADWRSWWVSAGLGEADREAALRKAVQLNPDNALTHNDLAWLLAKSDRAREALPLANRALDLAPWNASIIDTLAEVAARMGKCPEARHLEKRAVTIEPTDGMRMRQAEIERRCSTGLSRTEGR